MGERQAHRRKAVGRRSGEQQMNGAGGARQTARPHPALDNGTTALGHLSVEQGP